MGKPKRMKDPFQKSKGVNVTLNIIMLLGFLGAAAQIIATVMYSWRVADKIHYPFKYRGKWKHYYVGETRYGLYKVSYDDESLFETWTQRVENMKQYGAIAAQKGKNEESAGVLSLYTSTCPGVCRKAINARISAYERISLISLIFLCSLVISSSVVLLTLGWTIMFSKSIFILMGAFVLSIVINATAGGYWYYETDRTWNIVIKAQQYPFPRCSHSFYIYLASTVLFGLCFAVLLLTDCVSKMQQRRGKMNKLMMHNNMKPVMNPPPMMYPQMMYNNQNNLMPRSTSFTSRMAYPKNENFDYPNYMQSPVGDPSLNFHSSFLNNPSPNMNPNFYQPLTRNFSYSAGMGAPPGYPHDVYGSYNNNLFDGTFGHMPSKDDMNYAKKYSGMNYVNNPYGPNSSFRF